MLDGLRQSNGKISIELIQGIKDCDMGGLRQSHGEISSTELIRGNKDCDGGGLRQNDEEISSIELIHGIKDCDLYKERHARHLSRHKMMMKTFMYHSTHKSVIHRTYITHTAVKTYMSNIIHAY